MTLLQLLLILIALSIASVISYSDFVTLNKCHTNLGIHQLFTQITKFPTFIGLQHNALHEVKWVT